jgi:hypothetical protein
MPTFIELGADYPLVLTLLEPAYPCALTWFDIAGFTSARAISSPLIRQNEPVPVSLYSGPSANFCSSARAPSASEFAWRLTPAHASLRERQSHVDEQLIFSADTTAQVCAAAVNSISASQQLLVGQISGMFGCRTRMRLRAFRKRNPKKEHSRFCPHSVACLFSGRQGKPGQN